MQHEADDENRDDDQPDGKRKNRVAIFPEYAVADVARLIEEERCDEHDEKELGVYGDVNGKLDEEVDGNTNGHLNEGE